MVKGWCTTYNIDFNITNCTNNFGPYQYPEKLIPLTLFRSLNLLPIQIYGDGKNVRDWIYVDDHIRCIYKVMTKGDLNSTYNISTKNELSNNLLVEKILSILHKFKIRGLINKYSDNIEYVQDRPAHDFRYSVDTSKFNKISNNLKYQSFDHNLAQTIKWYIFNKNWIKRNLI